MLTPKRFIGIELGATRVRAVQILRAGGGWRVEAAAERALPPAGRETGAPAAQAGAAAPLTPQGSGGHSGDATAQALQSLLRDGGFRAGAPAAASMPPGDVFFQSFDTDLLQLDDVRRVLKFETEGDFPFPPDDLVVDICAVQKLPDGRQKILAAAVARAALERTQRALRQAGTRCVRVDAAACALHGLASRSASDAGAGRTISLHLSEDNVLIAIGEEGRLVSVRNFSPPQGPEAARAEEIAREMELAWREVFAAEAPPETRCILGGDEKPLAGLPDALAKRTGLRVAAMNPFAGFTLPEGFQANNSCAVAVGMALAAAGEAPGANFLAADTAGASAARMTRRALIVAAVLIVAVVALWGVGKVLVLRALAAQLASMRSDTADVAEKVFHDRPAGNTPPQSILDRVDALLKEEKKTHDALSALADAVPVPLQVLQRIEARRPRNVRVKITDLSIDGRSVRMAGTTDSYTNVEELEKQLKSAPEFDNVAFPRAERVRTTQSVAFIATFSFRPRPPSAGDKP